LEATARATKQPTGRRNIPASATSLTARTDESIGVARWTVGLDAIEIIRPVEEAFDVRIEDAEAERIGTPGDLIELVMRKVAHSDAAGCLTHRAFNLARTCLLHQLFLERRDVTPQTRMADLAPERERKVFMRCLAEELETEPLPDLVRPRWLVALLVAPCLATGIGVVIALHKLAASLAWGFKVVVGAASAVVAAHLATLATRALRSEFPPVLATVGDLSRWIVAHKRDLGSPNPREWTREQVAARVREIVIEQLDCAKTYREEAAFNQDLGMDEG